VINARDQLFRQLQVFFETYLRGICAWHQVEHRPAEKVEPIEGRSRYPLGKFKEIVGVRFGLNDILVLSPEEAPPLGRIIVDGPNGRLELPSLDQESWRKAGEFILAKQGMPENV
jgi:hypothetical protein